MAYTNPDDITEVLFNNENLEKAFKVNMTTFLARDIINWRVSILSKAFDIPFEQFEKWFKTAENYWQKEVEKATTKHNEDYAKDVLYRVKKNHYTFLTELVNGDERHLHEASLTKLWSHMEKRDPMVFISSYDRNATEEVNADNFNRLLSLADKFILAENTSGYTKIKGSYGEDGNVFNEQAITMYCEEGANDKLLEWAKEAGKSLKQELILYIDPDGHAYYIHEDGKQEDRGDFTTERVTEFFEAIDGGIFNFNESRITPRDFPKHTEQSYADCLQHYGESARVRFNESVKVKNKTIYERAYKAIC